MRRAPRITGCDWFIGAEKVTRTWMWATPPKLTSCCCCKNGRKVGRVSEANYFGTLNVFNAAHKVWESKCLRNKSLYARRLWDFYTRCFKFCFNFFIILFLLFRYDFYEHHSVDYTYIYHHFWSFNAIVICNICSIYAFETNIYYPETISIWASHLSIHSY